MTQIPAGSAMLWLKRFNLAFFQDCWSWRWNMFLFASVQSVMILILPLFGNMLALQRCRPWKASVMELPVSFVAPQEGTLYRIILLPFLFLRTLCLPRLSRKEKERLKGPKEKDNKEKGRVYLRKDNVWLKCNLIDSLVQHTNTL